MRKRTDGVEEVETGLVNKHIFWRSAGGNALEGKGYEFMTTYDTIVSMGAESIPDATEILLSLTTIKNVMVSIISERRLVALGR